MLNNWLLSTLLTASSLFSCESPDSFRFSGGDLNRRVDRRIACCYKRCYELSSLHFSFLELLNFVSHVTLNIAYKLSTSEKKSNGNHSSLFSHFPRKVDCANSKLYHSKYLLMFRKSSMTNEQTKLIVFLNEVIVYSLHVKKRWARKCKCIGSKTKQ